MANLSNGNYIPVIYRKKAQLAYENKLCFSEIVSRDIAKEKEIKGHGDSVVIPIVGNLTMQDYTKDGTINWADLPDEKVTINIDQQKILPIKVDDIDAVQADINVLSEYAEKSGYAVGNDVEQYVFGLHADADSSNIIGTDLANALDCGYGSSEYSPVKILAACKRMLSKNNAFTDSPWFVGPPEFFEQLMSESGKAIEANSMGTPESIALKGIVGMLMGFKLFESNNLTTSGTAVACCFGNKGSVALAQQINKVTSLTLESTAADGIRTLSVYGAKVVRPEGFGCAYLKFDLEA